MRTVLVAVVVSAVASAASASVTYAQTAPLLRTHTPRPTHATISAADLMTRLYIFADDSMEGRRFRRLGNVKATAYLAAELQRLGLEPAGDSGSYFQTLPSDSNAPPEDHYPARNVVAILRGRDPTLNHTYVAIGAHNDHIGIRSHAVDHDSLRTWMRTVWQRRYVGRLTDSVLQTLVVNVDSLHRLRPARPDSIRNGADDDGSGSVAVLEIAEALARLPRKPKRSILFVFHTGEEAGMVGSQYFVTHPTVPLDSIVTQVNLDMIGRGRRDDTPEGGPNLLMAVGASRLSRELGQIVEDVNRRGRHRLRLDYTWDAPDHPEQIYTRSDHYSYASHGIPIVFFFTGLHADYHQVTDEPQYIDYPHLARITRYVYDLVLRLGTLPHRPVVDQPAGAPPGHD